MATQQAEAPPRPTAHSNSGFLTPGVRMVAVGLATALATAAALVAVVATSGPPSHQAETRTPALRGAAAGDLSQRAETVHYTGHPIETPGNTYGYVPAWLGRAKVPVGRLVTATPQDPWLAIQGDTVRVKLPRAQVLATVFGPSLPQQRQLPIPKTSPCKFTLTLTGASAPIAVVPRQFDVIDEQGRLHTLKVTNHDNGQPPSEVTPGENVGLKMYAVLPVGQGRIMWSPLPGKKPIVQWDFDVEIN